MSDRLEDIKKKPFQRPLQVITDGDILWLIAEVERLRVENVDLKEFADTQRIGHKETMDQLIALEKKYE